MNQEEIINSQKKQCTLCGIMAHPGSMTIRPEGKYVNQAWLCNACISQGGAGILARYTNPNKRTLTDSERQALARTGIIRGSKNYGR